MLPFVSIIIPVFNIEKYVERCIASVMAQRWRNLECLIINDFSTDDSMKLVQKMLDHYEGPISFRVIHHEKNRGLSAARNTGTQEACGDYILYLDGDDMLMADSVSLLMAPLLHRSLDLVIGNYSVPAPDGTKNDYLPMTLDDGIIVDRQTIQSSYYSCWYVMAWNKIIRKNFLLENKIRFKEGAIHEDDIWSFEVACLACSMGVVHQNTYFYNIRPSSLNTRSHAERPLRMTTVLNECQSIAESRGIIDDPFVIKILLHYEGIIFSLINRQGTIRERYAFYKQHLHSRKFRKSWYSEMKLNTRLRYIHRRFPSMAGYVYLSMVSLLSPIVFGMLRHFSKKH